MGRYHRDLGQNNLQIVIFYDYVTVSHLSGVYTEAKNRSKLGLFKKAKNIFEFFQMH
jgi:hypothetical protein